MTYKSTLFTKNPDVQREFQRVEEALMTVHEFPVRYSEPDKYAQGMVVFADGTSWNPGSGEGLYVRLSTGWSKL